jgi:hypothetical protein
MLRETPDGYIELRSDRVGAPMLRFVSASLLTAMVLGASPALANEFCNKEMAPMVQQRAALTARLNDIGKHAKQPGAREKFCGTLTSYIGNITKFLTYMQQNKDFCGIPDEAIDSARKGLAQNQTLRKRVCSGPPPQAQQQGNGKPAVPRPPVELRLQ